MGIRNVNMGNIQIHTDKADVETSQTSASNYNQKGKAAN